MIVVMNTSAGEANDRRETLLLEYACGALNEAAALMVASWLTLSPEARRAVARYETVGGALMCQGCRPERMEESSLRRVLDKLECADRAARLAACRPSPSQDLPLPTPLAACLTGNPIWHGLCRGTDMAELPVPDGGRAMLLRSRPGAPIDRFRPAGFEMTLVLDGGFGDGAAFYSRGDLLLREGWQTGARPNRYVADSMRGCLFFVIGDQAPKLSPGGVKAFLKSLFRRP